MSALLDALPPSLYSVEPFVPHTLEHLTQVRAFPSPLPEVVYNKMLKEYQQLEDVSVSRMAYESGGHKVTGVLVMPREVQAKHPIIIYNRGGSREYGKLTLYTILRTLVPFARRGYMVFASNYRGNDGGEGVDEFGGRDVGDVMRLLDIARDHPAFDGRNIFMIGHSRGGLMTTKAIRLGAPLNAAISIAGVADARKLLNSQTLVEHVFKPLVPGFLTDPEAVLHDRSSLLWPEAITVPLLLMHGDADKDVDVNDSIELHGALGRAGKTSELVIYPSGSHALVRSWDDVMARSLGWFERYKA